MLTNRIELVVFDLGRVMVRLCDGWADACQRAGVPMPESLQKQAIRDQVRKVGYLHEVGIVTCEEFFQRVSAIVGLTPAQIEAISAAWLDGPYPGFHSLIDRVHAAGARTACLSNTNATHWRMMTTPGSPHHLPLDRLHYRIASHLVRAYKPEPAIYEALERASGVAPRAIVFFDDLELNCDGAVARGWRARPIVHPGDPVTQIATHLRSMGLLA